MERLRCPWLDEETRWRSVRCCLQGFRLVSQVNKLCQFPFNLIPVHQVKNFHFGEIVSVRPGISRQVVLFRSYNRAEGEGLPPPEVVLLQTELLKGQPEFKVQVELGGVNPLLRSVVGEDLNLLNCV